MKIRSLSFLLVLALVAALWAGIAPTPVRADDLACGIDLEGALKFVLKLQNEDGGFSDGFSPESKVGATADAVVAIAAAGENPETFKKGDNTPLSYLGAQFKAGKADNVGTFGKVLAAALQVEKGIPGVSTADLAKQVVAALGKDKDIDTSGYFGQALAIQAAATAGIEIPKPALERLVKTREAKTAGFSFDGKSPADTNTSALVISALETAGDRGNARISLEYLRGIQNADKGWPYQNPNQYGTDSDANSTALVLLALINVNEDLGKWGNPQNALKAFQQKDGSFTFQLKQPAPSFLATVAAIPALCAASEAMLSATPAATPKK